MSRNYVYTELTNAIEQAMLVGGLDSESTQISHFIAERGERFHFEPERSMYQKRFLLFKKTKYIREVIAELLLMQQYLMLLIRRLVRGKLKRIRKY